jgi:integrase
VSLERARKGKGYICRWREHGRQRSRKFDRAADAKSFDAEIRRRRQLGPLALQQLTGRGGRTLDQWIEERWAPEHGATLEQSTRERYANVYGRHILAELGDVPLGELTVARLRAWQAGLMQAGVKPGTVHKARTFLSSVLRHAAESEAIPGNPLSVIRAPKSIHRDKLRPLAPAVVELIRRELLDPQPRQVAASVPGQRKRRGYQLAAPGTRQTRQRDALIVSLQAYGGLRGGELRALRWGDVRDGTMHVERAAGSDGSIKATKNELARTVDLFAPLAQELREYRLAVGRPPDSALVLSESVAKPWTKADWQMWRVDRWKPACRALRLDPAPQPKHLRHSFVSLLLAARRDPAWVAAQAGHTLAVMYRTYWHLVDEYKAHDAVDPELEIANARARNVRSKCVNRAAATH